MNTSLVLLKTKFLSAIAVPLFSHTQQFTHTDATHKLQQLLILYAIPFCHCYHKNVIVNIVTETEIEWLACWTQAQKCLGSNRSRDVVE